MSEQNVTSSEISADETDTKATYTADKMRCLMCVCAILDVFSEIMQLILKQSGYSADFVYNLIYNDREFKRKLKPHEHDSLQSLIISNEYFGLDFSLIIKIIIRYPMFVGSAPTRGWGCKPCPNDITLADDAQRLRLWRNHFFHKVKPSTDVSDFESFFNDVEAICGRIDGSLKTNDEESFRTKIHKLRNNVLTIKTATKVEEEYESTKSLSEDFIIVREGSAIRVYRSPTFEEFHQEFNNGRIVNKEVHMTLTFENSDNPDIAGKMERLKEIFNQKFKGFKIENIRMGCLEIQLTVSDLSLFKNDSMKKVVTAVVEQLEGVLEIREWLMQQDVVVISVDDEHILSSEPSYSPIQVDLVFDRHSVENIEKFESLLKDMVQQIGSELGEHELHSDLHVLANLQRKPAASYQEGRDEMIHVYDCVEKLLNRYEYKPIFEYAQIQIHDYMKAVSTMHQTLMRALNIVLIGQDNDAKSALIRSITGREPVLKSTSPFSSGLITRFINSNQVSIAACTWDEETIIREEFKNLEDLQIFIDQNPGFSQYAHFLDVCYPFSSLKKDNITIVNISDDEEISKLQLVLKQISENVASVIVLIEVDTDKQELSRNLDYFVRIRTKIKHADILEAVFLSQLCSSPYCDHREGNYFDYRGIEWERPIKRIRDTCPELPQQNIYKVPLQQVKNKKVVQSNNEYFRFEYMLRKTIEKKQEELLKMGFRVIMSCRKLLEKAQAKILELENLDEKELQLKENIWEIRRLKSLCEERKKEMHKLKVSLVEELAKRLHEYLNTQTGMDEILNPAGKMISEQFHCYYCHKK